MMPEDIVVYYLGLARGAVQYTLYAHPEQTISQLSLPTCHTPTNGQTTLK